MVACASNGCIATPVQPVHCNTRTTSATNVCARRRSCQPLARGFSSESFRLGIRPSAPLRLRGCNSDHDSDRFGSRRRRILTRPRQAASTSRTIRVLQATSPAAVSRWAAPPAQLPGQRTAASAKGTIAWAHRSSTGLALARPVSDSRPPSRARSTCAVERARRGKAAPVQSNLRQLARAWTRAPANARASANRSARGRTGAGADAARDAEPRHTVARTPARAHVRT